MEWVEGARLSDRKMLDTYGLEPSRLVDTMVRLRLGACVITLGETRLDACDDAMVRLEW